MTITPAVEFTSNLLRLKLIVATGFSAGSIQISCTVVELGRVTTAGLCMNSSMPIMIKADVITAIRMEISKYLVVFLSLKLFFISI